MTEQPEWQGPKLSEVMQRHYVRKFREGRLTKEDRENYEAAMQREQQPRKNVPR